MKPLLLLEINEIPWRVIDRYRSDPRFGAIQSFFSRALTFTTITVDRPGMMDPWVTWPTLHRGMDNTRHNVKNLGQDPSTFRGVPIWEEFRKRGLAIGVFGSLQSWPPVNPGSGGFYVPDTFAHDPATIPRHIEPFQRFNLSQVSRNGRVVRGGGLMSREAVDFLLSIPRSGISFNTIRRLFSQILVERLNPTVRARRPIFQAMLSWDVFRSLYRAEAPPAFSTFFTNHVAGVMHRYWRHVFPEDFGDCEDSGCREHLATMDFAMQVLDDILSGALMFIEKNPEIVVVFATSMGQGPVKYEWHQGYEASIADPSALMRAIGLESEHFKPLLAMAPQAAVEVPNPAHRNIIRKWLESAKTSSGDSMFVVLEIGTSMSITSLTPKLTDIEAGGFSVEREGNLISWSEAGIEMSRVAPGTAYHIPEGIMAVVSRDIEANDSRSPLPADQIKAKLIQFAGLSI